MSIKVNYEKIGSESIYIFDWESDTYTPYEPDCNDSDYDDDGNKIETDVYKLNGVKHLF